MKKTFNLEFCFKGSRTYVHGTDILSNIVKELGNEIKKIDLAFHGITINNMFFSSEKPKDQDIKVTFRCIHGQDKIKLFGIENNDLVACQYEYLEEKIVDNSTVDILAEDILLNIPTEYSFIEHIVAMNKSLLETLYSDINGKWYFTRLQLNENIQMVDVSSLKIILKSNFQFKLTKSSILVNDREIGFIYFSLIPKDS